MSLTSLSPHLYLSPTQPMRSLKTEKSSKILRFSANQIKTYNTGNKLRFDGKQNPEIDMNVTELIEYNGFSPEVHHVTTEDGFILG